MKRNQRDDSFCVQCLCLAIEKLMKQKDFSGISISELARTAGVSRATFYRNFSNKEDLLLRRMNLKTEHWIKKDSIAIRDLSQEEFLRFASQVFQFWYENQNFICLMLRQNLDFLLEKATDQNIRELLAAAGKDQSEFRTSFLIGGMNRSLIGWAKSGCRPKPNQLFMPPNDFIFSEPDCGF